MRKPAGREQRPGVNRAGRAQGQRAEQLWGSHVAPRESLSVLPDPGLHPQQAALWAHFLYLETHGTPPLQPAKVSVSPLQAAKARSRGSLTLEQFLSRGSSRGVPRGVLVPQLHPLTT